MNEHAEHPYTPGTPPGNPAVDDRSRAPWLAGADLSGPGADMKSIDIFPWSEHFATGLPEVDMQHRVLVGLLNELASHLAFDPERAHLERILGELGAYTANHFRTEEAAWEACLPDDAEMARHKAGHQDFADTIRRLQAQSAHQPIAAIVDETLTFLARWLATHILEHDRGFARVARGMRAGLAPAEARRRAAGEMQGAERVLIEAMLATYQALAANAVKLLHEMAERRHVEDSLQDSEARFRAIVEQSPIGIVLHRDGRVAQVNEASVKMFGYEGRAAMMDTDLYENLAPRCRTEVRERARHRLLGEPAAAIYETVGLRRDGSEFPLVLVPRVMRTADGPLIAAFLLDRTEPQRAEAAERSLNRTVKLLSRCNSLLMRATNKQALLAGVCQLAVEVGGYRMAWAGLAENDALQSVRPVAHDGHEEGYLREARISWGDNPYGQGPAGRAIRSGKTMLARDIQHAPDWVLWREAVRRRGYNAAIALPLRVEQRTIGMLGIYSADAQAFGPEEVALLEELAGDLSFGIEALRLRETREAAQRDLHRESDKNRALLHNASDGVHILDEHANLIEASDSFCAMLGYTRAELMGRPLSSWDAGGLGPAALAAAYRRVLESNERCEFHSRHRRRDGSLIDVEISTFPLTIEGRRLVFNSSRDVTESRRTRLQLEQTTQDLRRLLANFDSTLAAERTHIAREVHDELGQVLTSLGFAISTLRVKYGKTDAGLMELARAMAALNERALQVTRNVAENLRPAVLDMGIAAALEWLCTTSCGQSGLRCEFRASPGLDDMDEAQVDAVFRIAQESLTNVIRHAGASRVAISLARHDDGLHLTVYDNGGGFDPAAVGARRSFGLLGMEERVRGLGGSVRITSAPDEGATVAVHMPYRAREGAA